MTDRLLQLKIKVVNAGILARTKEDEAWDFYRLHTDDNSAVTCIMEIKVLEKRIKSIQKEIQVNRKNVKKQRHKMIDPYFQKWWKLSTKLEKEYGVKFNGKLEKLLETKQELEKQKQEEK